MAEIKIGGCYRHTIYGNCVVLTRNRLGFKIQVWGGPSGDKLYTFCGIKAADLSPRV